MGLFNKNKKNKANEPQSNELGKKKGVFHGFALLSEPKWSKTQFVAEKITSFLNFFLKENSQRVTQGA